MIARRWALRSALVSGVAGLAIGLLGTGAASADIFGPIGLASAGTLGSGQAQQAEYAHDSVISSNGDYVVFDGSVGGVRRASGALNSQRDRCNRWRAGMRCCPRSARTAAT